MLVPDSVDNDSSSRSNRDIVALLARKCPSGVVSVSQAASLLGWTNAKTSSRLQRLAQQGWLSRAQRGVYFVRPIDETGSISIAADPWLLGAELFSPCYIGGWSAAEHWGLTEQLFRSTFIVTANAGRRRQRETLLGSEFRIVRVTSARVESVPTIWRGGIAIRVSSAERTLADALTHPAWVGGVRHLAEMMGTYRERDAFRPAIVLDELERLDTGAGAKRYGFLAERLWKTEADTERALAMRSQGVIKLDPAVKSVGRIDSRWGLAINVKLDDL